MNFKLGTHTDEISKLRNNISYLEISLFQEKTFRFSCFIYSINSPGFCLFTAYIDTLSFSYLRTFIFYLGMELTFSIC